jgi:hypothetical protein
MGASASLPSDENLKSIIITKIYNKNADDELVCEQLDPMFRRFDENGDGRISRDEFVRGVESMGFQNIPDTKLNELLDRFDANGDGSVDHHEFLQFFNRRPLEDMSVTSSPKDLLLSLMRSDPGSSSTELAFETCGALRSDRDLQLAAASLFPRQLGGIPGVGSDKEVVLAAVRRNAWDALQWVDPSLRLDREVLFEAMRQNGEALIVLIDFVKPEMPELAADREVVLAAVTQNGFVLEKASEELRADRNIVLAAVRQNVRAVEYAAERLRSDPEVRPFFDEYTRLCAEPNDEPE